ncbi:MAG: hypothetical protein HY332_19930 [Chloroflexi bacterium]|nr:hypothetical protein [Chloroflexota bacterium]
MPYSIAGRPPPVSPGGAAPCTSVTSRWPPRRSRLGRRQVARRREQALVAFEQLVRPIAQLFAPLGQPCPSGVKLPRLFVQGLEFVA